MLIMGITGGIYAPHEDDALGLGSIIFHDASAVLVHDGKVLAGAEEERFNRIKHTNKAPLGAMRFCLESTGTRIEDVDYVAYYADSQKLNAGLTRFNLLNAGEEDRFPDFSSLFRASVARALGAEIDPAKLVFVSHHLAHAMSAFAPSGFERALLLTIDAEGDDISGMVLQGQGRTLTPLCSYPVSDSLGYFYLDMIRFIGFGDNEEYKVMGLAPYGDPARFAELFSSLYELRSDGRYSIFQDRFVRIFEALRPRKRFEDIEQVHKDFAAGLQQALENLVFHILRHFRTVTDERKLCMAGGVAQNCTLNGKILASGLFDEVFVQPVAHDAGCALGAALYVHAREAPEVALAPLEHLYWGRHVGEPPAIESTLRAWQGLIEFERVENAAERAAELLADGRVIGWVQERSEFGPRALGSRSILADPRPAENKEIINAMVKKREAFRPFAPSVLEENAHEFFDIPKDVHALPFMIFIVPVRPDKRELLGAVTHVDGTARIQTVSRQAHPRYWELIRCFAQKTGVPIVLNTSFNNNAEPIVDTVEDALVCFLTTKLHQLVVGDYVVAKKPRTSAAFAALVPALPAHIKLRLVREVAELDGTLTTRYEITNTYDSAFRHPISEAAFGVLTRADGRTPIAALLDAARSETLLTEIEDLWSRRLLALRPNLEKKH